MLGMELSVSIYRSLPTRVMNCFMEPSFKQLESLRIIHEWYFECYLSYTIHIIFECLHLAVNAIWPSYGPKYLNEIYIRMKNISIHLAVNAIWPSYGPKYFNEIYIQMKNISIQLLWMVILTVFSCYILQDNEICIKLMSYHTQWCKCICFIHIHIYDYGHTCSPVWLSIILQNYKDE